MTGSEGQAAILELVRQLRDDFAQEREAARQSRTAQHDRIDEVIQRLGRMDTSAALSGQVDAQVRIELDALKSAVQDISPTIAEWRRIRHLGLGIVGLMTAGGLTVGAMLQWGGDGIVNVIRGWLRIH